MAGGGWWYDINYAFNFRFLRFYSGALKEPQLYIYKQRKSKTIDIQCQLEGWGGRLSPLLKPNQSRKLYIFWVMIFFVKSYPHFLWYFIDQNYIMLLLCWMVTVNLMNLVFYCNSRELCQQKGFQLFKKKIITYCNTSSSDRKGIPVYIFKKM